MKFANNRYQLCISCAIKFGMTTPPHRRHMFLNRILRKSEDLTAD